LVKINIGHAYLLKGEYTKALDVYKEGFGIKIGDKAFQQYILEDFETFKKKGIIHPDMDKIEKIIKELNTVK